MGLTLSLPNSFSDVREPPESEKRARGVTKMASFVTGTLAAVSRCARSKIRVFERNHSAGSGGRAPVHITIPAPVAHLRDPPRSLSNRHNRDGVHREVLTLSGLENICRSKLRTIIRILSPLARYTTNLSPSPL